MRSQPKAVIFDLDGTLLDSLEDIANATNHALFSAGLPTHPLSAYRHFVGEGVFAMLHKATPAEYTSIAPLVETMKTTYAASWDKKTHLYSGIADMLTRLVALSIPLAVFSNKPDSFTRLMVAHFFPRTPFACVLGQKDPTPPKPHPQGALDIARGLNVTPQSCYFVGDTKTDMETANRAGMTSVGVTWGFRDERELRDHAASVIIHHPSELFSVWQSE